jgi:FAD/FMN-containing dehydrogenase
VVPQGGLTGLVQGASSTVTDIIVSLERMNAIEEVDGRNRTMTVQAGVTLQSAQSAAEAADLFLPLDLAARGSCTIGGNIATNAGGNRVIRYGMARDCVLGLEAVLADGRVLSSMNRMVKNNAGYDLKQLFIGSEGTLGIVARAVLRLRERPASQIVCLAAASDFDAVAALLKHMDHGLGGGLSAFEVMWREYYETVTAHIGENSPPLRWGLPCYVLMEMLGADAQADERRFEEVLEQALALGLVVDAVIAKSKAEADRIWATRDRSENVERAAGPTIGFDVSLPIAAMRDYVATVRAGLAAVRPGVDCYVFGHVGDGNLHFMIPGAPDDLEARERTESVVYGRLQGLDGSISAEHGIGLEKKSYLPLSRSTQEMALMRALKSALDPAGILNPGKIF